MWCEQDSRECHLPECAEHGCMGRTGWLTDRDVLGAHAEHGELDWHMVKKAMGPNWPAHWEILGPGEGTFCPEEDRTF